MSDYFYMNDDERSMPMLIMKFCRSKRIGATALAHKGITEYDPDLVHIYVGSLLTNCVRKEGDQPPPISAAYMFAMWFSGLRGGVAFALASVSFAHKDFKPGDWTCVACQAHNFARNQACLYQCTLTGRWQGRRELRDCSS